MKYAYLSGSAPLKPAPVFEDVTIYAGLGNPQFVNIPEEYTEASVSGVAGVNVVFNDGVIKIYQSGDNYGEAVVMLYGTGIAPATINVHVFPNSITFAESRYQAITSYDDGDFTLGTIFCPNAISLGVDAIDFADVNTQEEAVGQYSLYANISTFKKNGRGYIYINDTITGCRVIIDFVVQLYVGDYLTFDPELSQDALTLNEDVSFLWSCGIDAGSLRFSLEPSQGYQIDIVEQEQTSETHGTLTLRRASEEGYADVLIHYINYDTGIEHAPAEESLMYTQI